MTSQTWGTYIYMYIYVYIYTYIYIRIDQYDICSEYLCEGSLSLGKTWF